MCSYILFTPACAELQTPVIYALLWHFHQLTFILRRTALPITPHAWSSTPTHQTHIFFVVYISVPNGVEETNLIIEIVVRKRMLSSAMDLLIAPGKKDVMIKLGSTRSDYFWPMIQQSTQRQRASSGGAGNLRKIYSVQLGGPSKHIPAKKP